MSANLTNTVFFLPSLYLKVLPPTDGSVREMQESGLRFCMLKFGGERVFFFFNVKETGSLARLIIAVRLTVMHVISDVTLVLFMVRT